ncbi:MAG: hypothetical protein IPN91_10810 [Holophagaceae bacterium]|uniref:Uncharacterized protein n=1 Tax=Candidatus Geothrix odensensis TaxID=2954440 RepID=A0A936F2Y7_9BACT|nr:hypothetical protein [Candidatus Geothrix odensensis]
MAQGLVLGTLAGEAAALAYMATRAESPSLRGILRRAGGPPLSRLLRAYDDFVVGGTLSEFVSTVAFSLPVVLFGWRYSPTAAGHFSLSHRLIWAPVMMLGSALAQVLYKRLAGPDGLDLYKHKIFKSFWLLLSGLTLVGLGLGIALPLLLQPFMKKTGLAHMLT